MIRKTVLIAATLFISIVTIEPALATGSMRCGTHVITAGQRSAPFKHEVLKKCGEPTSRNGNTWIYKKSSSVSRVVRFGGDGQLYAIE
jgi:hypothetical protein